MTKTPKEMAFLREQYVEDDWTRRFAELADKHVGLADTENVLYVNAGTGGHALALGEKYGEKTDIFASCETEEMLTIARDKAAALSSGVDFSTMRFESDAFDAVIADASFTRPNDLEDVIADAARVARTGGDVAVLLCASGSFGEIFSLLWEVTTAEDLTDRAHLAESLITELPSAAAVEDMAERAGLVNVRTEAVNEVFEFDDGESFVAAPLIADFLMPAWLSELEEDEKERAVGGLARLIDDEDGTLSFRFTVKAMLLTGEKG